MLSTADIFNAVSSASAAESDNDDDTGDTLPRVTSQQAMAALSNIQSYLLCNGSDVYSILRDLEIEIIKAPAKKSKQTLITDFVVQ